MAELSELKEMLNAKSNDVNSFIWKGAKEVINGEKVQNEIRLMDATEAQLNKFYQHCQSMLYSNDKTNPGRYTLLNIIKSQREKCNAELFVRYVENTYIPSNDRLKLSRYTYLQSVKECLNNNKDTLPNSAWKNTSITAITNGVPEEFYQLSIDSVLSACLDSLGIFDRKHITLNFLAKLGVWFTQQELRDLTERDADGNIRNRIDVVQERLGLKSKVRLHTDPESMLNYTELRSMLNLKTKKYSELTTDQLLTLRNKILFNIIVIFKYNK